MRTHNLSRKWLAVGALLNGLLLAGPAAAQVPGVSNLSKLRAAAAKKQALAPVVAELHGIKVLLERADRDYKGHRAAAVREISAAIHALAPRPKGRGRAPAGGGGEPQALSDAQLRAAIAQLNTVGTRLSGLPGKGPARAVGHVGAAVQQLQVALTIK
jgi:hypothetical protein